MKLFLKTTTGLVLCLCSTSAFSLTNTSGCSMDGKTFPFVSQTYGSQFGTLRAFITPNLFAEYKDVWNSDTLTLTYKDKVIGTHSEIMAKHLQVSALLNGQSIKCQINK